MMVSGPGFPPDTDLDRDGENYPSFVISHSLPPLPHFPTPSDA